MIRDLLTGVALAGLCSGVLGDERGAVPLYTNADLDRVAPRRGETGVTSTPAAIPSVAPGGRSRDDRRASESHWRQEADRVRQRVRELRDRAQSLRERAEDQRVEQERARRSPGRRRPQPAGDRSTALDRDAARLEAQARDEEDRLAERARRAGALPGWIR